MFNIKWDPETNGVLLVDGEGDIQSAVRPVFYEELDILKFDHYGFTYSPSKDPLLWAAGRSYYYKGEKIAEVLKGGIVNEVDVKILVEPRELEPAQIDKILEKNEYQIQLYSHDSIDFIRDTFKRYKNNADIFAVSYSGGKDSVIVADLVKRSLDYNSFVVIFSDTKMESPDTYQTIRLFSHNNPKMKFYIAEYNGEAMDLWEEFGSPSRIIRWCHTVFKTAPFIHKIKEITGLENPKVLTFEGVRAEESNKRSKYDAIHEGTGGMNQINARPILHWSSLEVFLYIFQRKLPINPMYRKGYSRVGCLICPYSSGWSDYLSRKLYFNEILPYVKVLSTNAESSGVQDIDNFMNNGEWKKRSGGKYLDKNSSKVIVNYTKEKIVVQIEDPTTDFVNWLLTLSGIVFHDSLGSFEFNKNQYTLEKSVNKNVVKFVISGPISNDILFPVKRIAYKSGYCIRCGACEVVCPQNAIHTSEHVIIDRTKCNHCLSCVNHIEKGCWVAFSIAEVGVGYNMKQIGNVDRYSGFGLRKEWMNYYLSNGDDWDWSELGAPKVSGMKRWLQDSEFWDRKTKTPSELGKLFQKLNDPNDLFMWSVLWNNLGFIENSPLIRWYMLYLEPGEYQKEDLIRLLSEYRGGDEPNRTDVNAITALINLFENSPMGSDLKFGIGIKYGKKKYINKGCSENVPDLAVLYSVYRYGEHVKRHALVASELVNQKEITPFWSFGLDYPSIKAVLTRISSQYPDLIKIEFSGNLDTIYLSENIAPIEVIRKYIGSKI